MNERNRKKSLIAMIGKHGTPPPAIMAELKRIVDAQVARVAALPSHSTYRYYAMIALDAYNYGMMQGKRMERERRKRKASCDR